MKSGIRNNKTLKIASATMVTLFSLVSVFAASIAWFSLNKDVEPNQMDMNIVPASGKLKKVYFHSFLDENHDDNIFQFNKTPFCEYTYNWTDYDVDVNVEASTSDWEFEDYTALDHNHPVLIIFELNTDYTSTSEGDIFIQGSTTVNGFLGDRQSNGQPVHNLSSTQVHDDEHLDSLLMKIENGTYFYALSSVVEFSSRTFSSEQYDDFLEGNTGSTLDFLTSTLDESEHFCDVDNAAETFVFNQKPFLYKSDGSSTVKYVALVIEYSSDAIGFIYSTYLGDRTLESRENILRFACDWSLEVY